LASSPSHNQPAIESDDVSFSAYLKERFLLPYFFESPVFAGIAWRTLFISSKQKLELLVYTLVCLGAFPLSHAGLTQV
jgi:hypothetical protein